MQKNRRRSRELALQSLYACDVSESIDCVKVLRSIVDESETDETDAAQYARTLVTHAYNERETIDALLQRHAANWDVRRMTAIDRNVLRMAVAELTYCSNEVPFKEIGRASCRERV